MIFIYKYLPKEMLTKKDLYEVSFDEILELYALAKKSREIEVTTMQNAVVRAFSNED